MMSDTILRMVGGNLLGGEDRGTFPEPVCDPHHFSLDESGPGYLDIGHNPTRNAPIILFMGFRDGSVRKQRVTRYADIHSSVFDQPDDSVLISGRIDERKRKASCVVWSIAFLSPTLTKRSADMLLGLMGEFSPTMDWYVYDWNGRSVSSGEDWIRASYKESATSSAISMLLELATQESDTE